MATVKVSMGGAMGAGAPVYPPQFGSVATAVSTASSAAVGAIARAGDYAHVASSGGDVHAGVGGASTSSGLMVASGETKSIGPLQEGDQIFIMNV